MEFRTIADGELEVLRAWLDHDVPGAPELRRQLSEQTRVRRSCDCGCASLGFDHDETEPGVSVFGVDAEIVDADGTSVGGMVLLTKNGKLHDIDLHSWFDELEFPDLSSVRWQVREQPA